MLALLLKYRQGECSEAEVLKIHLWYESLNQESRLSLNDSERELLEARMLSNLRSEIFGEQVINETRSFSRWWVYSGIAASLLIGLSYFFFSRNAGPAYIDSGNTLMSQVDTKIISVRNRTAETQEVRLPDNSVVVLSPGAGLMYGEKFEDDKREVQLTGDAFFEVSKNPAKPFFVYSGKLVTRVLGTSFRIKTDEKTRAMEVEVVTGKVSVFENEKDAAGKTGGKQNGGVVLTPNQRVTYFSESGHLMTSIVDVPAEIEKAKGNYVLDFNNAPIAQITAVLQKQYGIEIMFANDHLEKCTFTGDVSDMPLYEKLDLICKSNSASYEVKGTRILITGDGCE